ncbi:MAG: magnesium chelatase, subunit, partial [Pseudomonadota bacterium]
MNLKLTTHSLKPTPRDTTPIKLVVVTMDTHFASSFNRANAQLKRDFPGLTWSLHAASEYTGNDALIAKCKADIASADIVLCGMLFLEDHFLPILDDLRARRMNCDAMVCMASATEVTQLTRFGQ